MRSLAPEHRELMDQLLYRDVDLPLIFRISESGETGFLPQAAVERLAGFRTGQGMPFLLVRVNDWVGPVRKPALAAVEARLTSDFAPDFAPAFVRCLRSCSAWSTPLAGRTGRC